MNVAVTGIRDQTLIRLVQDLADEMGLNVSFPTQEEVRRRMAGGDGEWEILLIGRHFSPDLPEMLARLVDESSTGIIIVLGGLEEEEMRQACLTAGAFDILPDRPDAEQLRLCLGRAVNLLNRLERQINSQKIEVIAQLAAGINHEINNPLTGLMGTAELMLMDQEKLPEKAVRDVKTILSEARRIQVITARLRHLDHLRTVPYTDKESMIDLVGEGGEERAEAEAPPAEETVFTAPRILIVDDNPLILDLIDRYLGERFTVDRAVDSTEALRKLKAGHYDLGVYDLVMPMMDGLELLRETQRTRPGMRVVIATAYSTDPRLERAMAEGAVCWIRKPFNFEELEQRLWDALGGSNSDRRNGSM